MLNRIFCETDYLEILQNNNWAKFRIVSQKLFLLNADEVKKYHALIIALEKEYFEFNNRSVSKYLGYLYFRKGDYSISHHFFEESKEDDIISKFYYVLNLIYLKQMQIAYEEKKMLTMMDYEFLSGELLFLDDVVCFCTFFLEEVKELFPKYVRVYEKEFLKNPTIQLHDYFIKLRDSRSFDRNLIEKNELYIRKLAKYTPELYVSLFEHLLLRKDLIESIRESSVVFPFTSHLKTAYKYHETSKLIDGWGKGVFSTPIRSTSDACLCVDDVEVFSDKPEGYLRSAHGIKYKGQVLILDFGAGIADGALNQISLDEFSSNGDFDKQSICGIVISHSHLDHYGSISTIDRSIPVYMTNLTLELLHLTSTNIMFPLINPVEFYEVLKIGPFAVRLIPNGHILGSAMIEILCGNKRIIYTGDFCIDNQLTVEGMKLDDIKNEPTDILIMETTYGHKLSNVPKYVYRNIFKYLVIKSARYKDKILIPAFAIGRAQEAALLIREAVEESKYSIDASMVSSIGGLAVKVSRYYENVMKKTIFGGYIRDDIGIESKDNASKINILSSGMMQENSVSYKYLDQSLDDNLAVIKIGFISSNSLPLAVLNGRRNKNISLFDIPLSAHASYQELLTTLVEINPKYVKYVHGKGLLL